MGMCKQHHGLWFRRQLNGERGSLQARSSLAKVRELNKEGGLGELIQEKSAIKKGAQLRPGSLIEKGPQ